ncbi:phospholipase D-like domain-containing protein [Alicyclobacillus sp. ALC3]|uniref:phospholipase D-like domain-containing protein n=1 Tax=Alicyclobacillus sp. ALC3 TaxID=2796143 RepID=UPI002378B1E3|nr:phospholipase D-like domain-containing protein [Alicyclobacillus sp. ALC3]WDL98114.1 hypothetical protein JC200_05280 [Alicyclobacillus sp. ALC3]
MAVETGIKLATYFSPDDDTMGAFVECVQSGKKSIYIADFAWHAPKAKDDLIAKKKAGLDVEVILDATEGGERYEQAAIEEMREAGIVVWLTHSQHGKYMHHKFMVVDGICVLSGSWNFSESASLEDNYFDIIENEQRAALFMSKWTEIRDYAKADYMEFNPWAKEASAK